MVLQPIYAKLIYPVYNYEDNIQKVEQPYGNEKLETLGLYKVSNVNVEQSTALIFLEGFNKPFNIGQFEFYDATGAKINFFEDVYKGTVYSTSF